MNLKNLAVAILTLGFSLQLYSQGVIVPNGVTYVGYSLGYTFAVLQNPTNGNPTGFFLDPQGANAFSFSTYTDEGVRVFLVSASDPVSLQGIQTLNYPELTFPNNYVFNNGVPFYVGLYTGEQFPQNGIYPNPLFGWARLVNNSGVINLLDGALEYGGGGIYAGTQTIIPVPEPSVLILSALGGVFLGWRCRRNS
ncbi:MAG: PEP-CTERM sorting domain-containing protein [Verrucomicrobia bacterium]|nr:PEP-CTERM sorting domain-containing protein [Verrucomicrobiota bacterium]